MILHVIQFVMVITAIKIYQKLLQKGMTFQGMHDIIMIESKEDKPTGQGGIFYEVQYEIFQ